jgi:hypothetical protein
MDATHAAVRQMIARATEWSLAKEFDRRRSQCTQLLGEAFAALFSRHQQRCSLDSLHHRFVHNMQIKYTRAEVAALVGFLSNETVVDYGKRRPISQFMRWLNIRAAKRSKETAVIPKAQLPSTYESP